MKPLTIENWSHSIDIHWPLFSTWWFIPRIVSGLVHPRYKWTLPPLIPFITRVITHLLSGMNHQVPIHGFYRILLFTLPSSLWATCGQSHVKTHTRWCPPPVVRCYKWVISPGTIDISSINHRIQLVMFTNFANYVHGIFHAKPSIFGGNPHDYSGSHLPSYLWAPSAQPRALGAAPAWQEVVLVSALLSTQKERNGFPGNPLLSISRFPGFVLPVWELRWYFSWRNSCTTCAQWVRKHSQIFMCIFLKLSVSVSKNWLI